MKHRVTTKILDATTEMEGLSKDTRNIEVKLLEVKEDLDKLKSAKMTYPIYFVIF